jgi:hypothetical protein
MQALNKIVASLYKPDIVGAGSLTNHSSIEKFWVDRPVQIGPFRTKHQVHRALDYHLFFEWRCDG